jgi:hypothetical protein
MRTIFPAIGFCLLNLVAGHAQAQDASEAVEAVDAVKPRIYALVAAVGAQFSVVSARPSIGSHLSPYRRSTIEVPDNILNRFALHGLDRAIANIDPKSERIYMTLPAAQMDGVEPSQRESVATGKIVSELEKMPQRLEWNRIVIATPAYRGLELNGLASKLQGFGLFLQPLCQSDNTSCEYGFRPPSGPHALTPENKVIAANEFLAPFSYIEVWVVDPKTLTVLDKQQGFDNQKLADPTARMLDISQSANREFLASRINSLIELSIDEAVKHTELSGKVEVGEPKVVNPDDDKK